MLKTNRSVNVLIDISRHANGKMWNKSERVRFVRDYFIRLYERQGEERRPMMQIVDEAARFAPEQRAKRIRNVARGRWSRKELAKAA